MASGVVLAAAAAFNLICQGYQSSSDMMKVDLDPPRQDYSVTLRIDLSAGRWCADDCTTTRPIYRAEDRMLILDKPMREGGVTNFEINRESGEAVENFVVGKTIYLRSMRCAPAPFTGMPARLF